MRYFKARWEIRTGLFPAKPNNIEIMRRDKRGFKWAILIQFPRISFTSRKALAKAEGK
uniref:Uncharacterized protein n=1 Tax=viral metagenome TaxID=1070528 RepID=A0A6H2A650_9ZZZZ